MATVTLDTNYLFFSELSSKNITHGISPEHKLFCLWFVKSEAVVSFIYIDSKKSVTLSDLYQTSVHVTMVTKWLQCVGIKNTNKCLCGQSLHVDNAATCWLM